MVTDAVLTDLPGYGYAAVPKADKVRWQQVMANYLVERRNLLGVVLMVDSRLGLTPLDEQLLEWLAPRLVNGSVRLLVLLTKADKLNRTQAQQILTKTQERLGEHSSDEADIGVCLFSALSGQGLGDVAAAVHAWLPPTPAPAAQAVTP